MRERLTKSDVKKIEEEIEYRKLVVRREAIEAVKEARAHGDLSENFEYHAAKKDKNKNESRIRYLERMRQIEYERGLSDNPLSYSICQYAALKTSNRIIFIFRLYPHINENTHSEDAAMRIEYIISSLAE